MSPKNTWSNVNSYWLSIFYQTMKMFFTTGRLFNVSKCVVRRTIFSFFEKQTGVMLSKTKQILHWEISWLQRNCRWWYHGCEACGWGIVLFCTMGSGNMEGRQSKKTILVKLYKDNSASYMFICFCCNFKSSFHVKRDNNAFNVHMMKYNFIIRWNKYSLSIKTPVLPSTVITVIKQ